MSLYKVLLVDDEVDVRQAIVKKLNWSAMGFVVVGQASNGREALELAEQLAPDVVMTDIKMPFMDGLELCRRIKPLLPGVRLAIFSGFDEFEYAKEAIAQQVAEYILKPVDATELAGVFRRIKTGLDQEIAQRRDVERLRRHYKESLPLMRQQLLVEWLGGAAQPARQAAAFAGYGLDYDAGAYCVATLRAEHAMAARGSDEERLFQLSLQQLVADSLPPARFHQVQTSHGMAVLFLLETGQDVSFVADKLNPLFPAAKKLLEARLSIGVGGVYLRADQVPASYNEATRALEYQVLVEPGQCLVLADIEPDAEGGSAPDMTLAEELIRQIKVGTAEDVQRAVGELLAYLKNQLSGIQQYQILLMELSTQLLKLIRTYRLDAKAARMEELLDAGRRYYVADLEAVGLWLRNFCQNLHALIRNERKDSARTLVERAKEILAQRYADTELSQDMVCRRLNVSPAYFSTLFKKETGQGFVGYLTALRMDKALELLATTDDKTYQIAEKVGYADTNYFSYVFKKQFGVSPSKYKSQAGDAP